MPKKTVQPIADQAYELLYHRIISCEYLPGQPLSEKQLLDETGFGRTPLREALLNLQKENLLEIFPRKGMRVAPFTEKSVNDLYQTRKLIEPTVVQSYKSLYAKEALLAFQKRFEASEQDEHLAHFKLDAAFHAYLIEVTDNRILINMYHALMEQQVRLAMYAAVQDARNRNDNLAQHIAIIDALLRENERDTRDAIIVHINHSLIASLGAIHREQL